MKKVISMILVVLMVVLAIPSTAFAASNEDSYVHYWYDSRIKATHVQFYELKDGSMQISDRVMVQGSKVYDSVGRLIITDLKDGERTVGFDRKGNLYMFSISNELRKMEHSYDEYYSVATAIKPDHFVFDDDDMVTKVDTDLKEMSLSEITFSGKHERHAEPVDTSGSYVTTESVDDSFEAVAYKAYAKAKLFLTTIAKASEVTQKDFDKVLTTKCRGAKLCGYGPDYSVYVTTLSGTIYQFKCEDGFSKANVVKSDVKVYKYEKSDKGFIKTVVTDKGNIDLGEKISVPNKPDEETPVDSEPTTKKVASCKVFQTKTMAYDSDGKMIGTLTTANGKNLTWKGKTISKSKDHEDEGVSAKGLIIWQIGKKIYKYDGKSVKLVASNGKSLVFNNKNVLIGYKTSTGKTVSIG